MMIKNYKQYNESLLDKMVGPTGDDIINSYGDDLLELLIFSIDNDFIKGVNYALGKGIDLNFLTDEYIFRYYCVMGYSNEEIVKLIDNNHLTLIWSVNFVKDDLIIYLIDEENMQLNTLQLRDLYSEYRDTFIDIIENSKKIQLEYGIVFHVLGDMEILRKIFDSGKFDYKKGDVIRLLFKAVSSMGNKEVISYLVNEIGIKPPKDLDLSYALDEETINLLKKHM